ncbi:MAG: AAA family ATPase [Gemmatimonadaceae bacterium]|nr:AAA family ATPase [Gemmatimonadaceae bacterium]
MPPRTPRRRTTATPVSDWHEGQPQLLAVRYAPTDRMDRTRFPLSVPTIASMTTLDVDAPVVCFVGENGSGKSTLLEAIAIAASLPSAGGAGRAKDDPTLLEQRWLAYALKLTWRTRNNRGFFLRAEDFFAFQNLLKRERAEFTETLARMEEEYADRSAHARALAMGPIKASLHEMEQRYGADPDARSHGEAFLNFFQQRLVPRGLYLMDEPEAALSPQRQLALLAMMFDLVADGAQFIIATHSPLLLAFPGARIYSFDESPIAAVPWDQTDHVRLTRDFLSDPERYLRNLRG